jgi:hypothetical protein
MSLEESKLTAGFYTLKSVDCVVSSNGVLKPLLSDGTTDLDDVGTPINEVTVEWVDELSDEDVLKVAEVLDNMSNVQYSDHYTYSIENTREFLKGDVKFK